MLPRNQFIAISSLSLSSARFLTSCQHCRRGQASAGFTSARSRPGLRQDQSTIVPETRDKAGPRRLPAFARSSRRRGSLAEERPSRYLSRPSNASEQQLRIAIPRLKCSSREPSDRVAKGPKLEFVSPADGPDMQNQNVRHSVLCNPSGMQFAGSGAVSAKAAQTQLCLPAAHRRSGYDGSRAISEAGIFS